jgi:hypothetical protein
VYYQTRWIQDTDKDGKPINLSRDKWTAAKKEYKADGTPKNKSVEHFMTKPSTVITVGILCVIAMTFIRYK